MRIGTMNHNFDTQAGNESVHTCYTEDGEDSNSSLAGVCCCASKSQYQILGEDDTSTS